MAREKKAVFILDPAPARALPKELLTLVHWLTPNEGEAATLLGLKELGDPLVAARNLKALGPRGVVLKLGGAGAVLLEEEEPLLIPAHKVEAVDTTAAGDAFNGGFLHAFLHGKGWDDCLRAGNICGSLAGTRPGGSAGLPGPQEYKRRMTEMRRG